MKTLNYNGQRLIVISFMLFVFSCGANSTTLRSDSSNLVQNSSFEMNGKPTLQSWIADTVLAKFVQDVPPNGGQWSLEIIPGWIPQEGFARTNISGQSGVGVYQLTAWVKSITAWEGSLSFSQWSKMEWVRSKRISCDSTSWTQFSLTDTLSLQPEDTIAVDLSAGVTELAIGKVLFDLVRFERIQTITSVEKDPNPLPNRFTLDQNYPNPFNPATAVTYQLPADGFVSLMVFDVMGREITTLVNEKQAAGRYRVNFDASTLTSGIYFYSIQSGQYRAVKKMLLIK